MYMYSEFKDLVIRMGDTVAIAQKDWHEFFNEEFVLRAIETARKPLSEAFFDAEDKEVCFCIEGPICVCIKADVFTVCYGDADISIAKTSDGYYYVHARTWEECGADALLEFRHKSASMIKSMVLSILPYDLKGKFEDDFSSYEEFV